jgi:hypothetical protein
LSAAKCRIQIVTIGCSRHGSNAHLAAFFLTYEIITAAEASAWYESWKR